MSKYLLDSDIIIAFLRGEKKTIKLLKDLEKIAGVPATSPICVAEVQAGVRSGEEEKTNGFLESLKIYVLDRGIANKAGEYIREYQKRGITLLLPDALISATCTINSLILATYNIKHYPMPEVKFAQPGFGNLNPMR